MGESLPHFHLLHVMFYKSKVQESSSSSSCHFMVENAAAQTEQQQMRKYDPQGAWFHGFSSSALSIPLGTMQRYLLLLQPLYWVDLGASSAIDFMLIVPKTCIFIPTHLGVLIKKYCSENPDLQVCLGT